MVRSVHERLSGMLRASVSGCERLCVMAGRLSMME